MHFDKFIQSSVEWWESYFNFIQHSKENGRVRNPERMLFPTIALFINYGKYYVMELLGASKDFRGISIKRQRAASVMSYSDLFSDDVHRSAFRISGTGSGMSNLVIGNDVDIESAKRKFPMLDRFGSFLLAQGAKGGFLEFEDDCSDFFVENCIFVRARSNYIRMKFVMFSLIVKSTIYKGNVGRLYDHMIRNYRGIHHVHGVYMATEGEQDALYLSSQLQSLILFSGMHETTIGYFISSHPDIIKKALDTDFFYYELSLPWLEHDGTVNDSFIRPDLLVRRRDGFFDIYDFKLARTDKNSLTKGARSRRRFIDYISEGVHQLANYREYFSFKENSAFAESKYGIKIVDPKLILIAGHYENVSREEVLQACRPYQNVDLIDYDTFVTLLLRPKLDDASGHG